MTKQDTIMKVALSLTFVFIVTFFTVFFVTKEAQADTPFGGRMTSVIFNCECEPCRLVSIGPPRGGNFMYCIPYVLYDHRMPYPMRWQLGMAGSPKVCHELVCGENGCVCVAIGSGLRVIMVGTSLF